MNISKETNNTKLQHELSFIRHQSLELHINYKGFSCCTSQVKEIHGIPGEIKAKDSEKISSRRGWDSANQQQ